MGYWTNTPEHKQKIADEAKSLQTEHGIVRLLGIRYNYDDEGGTPQWYAKFEDGSQREVDLYDTRYDKYEASYVANELDCDDTLREFNFETNLWDKTSEDTIEIEYSREIEHVTFKRLT